MSFWPKVIHLFLLSLNLLWLDKLSWINLGRDLTTTYRRRQPLNIYDAFVCTRKKEKLRFWWSDFSCFNWEVREVVDYFWHFQLKLIWCYLFNRNHLWGIICEFRVMFSTRCFFFNINACLFNLAFLRKNPTTNSL